jgi:hypothetical protein
MISMAIKPATEVNWKPPPRCPICGVGVTPSGRTMPIVEDDEGRVYCRDHGDTIEPGYAAKLATTRRGGSAAPTRSRRWRKRRSGTPTSNARPVPMAHSEWGKRPGLVLDTGALIELQSGGRRSSLS